MTYKEEALRRLIKIGINEIDAKEIVEFIVSEYVPHVFSDFEQDDDDWDMEV